MARNSGGLSILVILIGIIGFIIVEYWWILIILLVIGIIVLIINYFVKIKEDEERAAKVQIQNELRKKEEEERAVLKAKAAELAAKEQECRAKELAAQKKAAEELEAIEVARKEAEIQDYLKSINAQCSYKTDQVIEITINQQADIASVISTLRGWGYEDFTIELSNKDNMVFEGVIFHKLENGTHTASTAFTNKNFSDYNRLSLDSKITNFIKCIIANTEIKDQLDIYNSILLNLPVITEKIKDESAIESHAVKILLSSDYGNLYKKKVESVFLNGMLLIDYLLPSIDNYPKTKEYKYIASRDEVVEVPFTNAVISKSYDNTLYRICLRSLFELFNSVDKDLVKAITFNGYVNALNRAIGKQETKCILSVQTTAEFFHTIDLTKVDPKTCFKNLKGVSAAKLIDISPIIPILTLNKTDHRFIESHSVTLDSGTNIASIDWTDFEHLVRELFEKEFSVNGGEVKVTQSSRDGGVDAVAFDPDPIRGGKIIIQAKRYTNTVGVSAVRDLYGTIINEGASSGILITTADYGADSYTFAKDKPIKLLNGGHLLTLLHKHGYDARINIEEAKEMAVINNKQ
jgi:HJR/Mrr/RecB family endonuclease